MSSLSENLLQVEPIRQNILSKQVYDRLLESIITGKISPGQHLVEQKLADHLGVSRISIREAIRLLAQQGVVKIAPNRGAFVIQITTDDIIEIYQLRAALEGFAVKQAVKNLNDENFQELQNILQKMREVEQTDNRLQGASIDTQFHRLIMSLSKNQRAIKVWEQMSTQIQMVVYDVSNFYQTYSGLEERHQKLVNFIQSGNAQAASDYVQHHIMEGAQHLLDVLL